MQRAVGVGEPLHGTDLAALRLHGEQQARAHRLAVGQHGASAADAVLAPEVGAGQTAVLAQSIGQGLARLDGDAVLVAVDPQHHGHGHVGGKDLGHWRETSSAINSGR